MDNKGSITALMSAFGRAFHAEKEAHPVFADHLAKELLTAEEYAAVQGYILSGAQFLEPGFAPEEQEVLLRRLVNVHIAPSPLCRAAYAEQALKTAALTGTRQYVMLGAGLDTFTFREPEFLSTHRVFEVDHPLMQADKRARIARAGWPVPASLTFVPMDFTRDNLAERLLAAGFDPSAKSFFSWLGVSYYLSTEAIDATLAALAGLCADGSTLVFDYPDEHFFTAPERRVQNTILMAKAGGEPMQSAFSYDELTRLLEKHGFLIYELLTPEDIQRDIIDKAGADMKALEHVNYCLAVRKKPFTIERARPEDAAALLDYLKIVGSETDNLSFGAEGVPLSVEAEQDYLRAQWASPDNAQYLAKVNGEIIGTASLNRRANRMRHRGVLGISLKKAWWGCGAAPALMEAILAFAKANGFEQLNLEVRSSNARAIRLYEKYGFQRLCTFPNFFKINGEYVDFDLMNLELGAADGPAETI